MTAVTAVSLFGGNNLLSSEEVLQLVPQPLFDAATEEAHRKGKPAMQSAPELRLRVALSLAL